MVGNLWWHMQVGPRIKQKLSIVHMKGNASYCLGSFFF